MIRIRARLQDVFAITWGGAKAHFVSTPYEDDVKQDERISDTPTMVMEVLVSNPAVSRQLVIGAYYDISIEQVRPVAAVTPKAA